MFRTAIATLFLIASAAVPALAQPGTVVIDRGTDPEAPYTLIYPTELTSVDDGSPVTVATLALGEAPVRCDAMIAEGPSKWSAREATDQFDAAATAVAWQADFPGFAVTSHGMTDFQSGPALLYRGSAPQSPWGIPVQAIHAEAVDGGRLYVMECVAGDDIAAEIEPLFTFLIANFSTRSDGSCCVTP